ncbi:MULTISPECIES: ABC transporter substrate-binding protein [Actinoalloteichus]|uniref:Glycine/betaine ABC transporter substrate-binding protein n=1 Tax=Actinoalloteichus fjordicus TaxID=1612552 RepID=A0AAC9LJ45_9PSEU|nr:MULTISPECIES: ABC transporter substrate-binding protein [Actinoalloteichus]APU17275.1 glycine/betaine ABC transporter substrate-binding protein [Actinoalloteichus fjordicus]APU23358.1 glycine/betaine ABC transporter substrate-binding protein [Actinoalloteichus sp. GBA129-24]
MRRGLATLAVGAVLVTGACGGGDPLSNEGGSAEDGQIIVGSADFAENQLLMEMYAEVLREGGAEVTTRPGVGNREFIVDGLQDGSLTIVPEYSGNLLHHFAEVAPGTSAEDIITSLDESLPAGLGILAPADAENSDVLVVTEETADRLELTSLADLGPQCDELVLGAAGEWAERWAEPIAELYDCTFAEIRTTDAGGPITVDELAGGNVDVANLFTTMSAIEENDFVELEDPERLYPAQQVIPLVRADALSDDQQAALDELSAALTTENLKEMVRRIEVDRENYADVAQEFVAGL